MKRQLFIGFHNFFFNLLKFAPFLVDIVFCTIAGDSLMHIIKPNFAF